MPAGSVLSVRPMLSVSMKSVLSKTVPFMTSPTMLYINTNMPMAPSELHVSRTFGYLRLKATSMAAKNAAPTAMKGLGSCTIISKTPPAVQV